MRFLTSSRSRATAAAVLAAVMAAAWAGSAAVAAGSGPAAPLGRFRPAFLTSITADSPTDLWAVGGTSSSDGQKWLIEHGDGSTWTQVQHPASAAPMIFDSTSATSPDDVWALGYLRRGTYKGPVMKHWDGTSWHSVKLPAGFPVMSSVSAASATSAWAVGSVTSHGSPHPIIYGWDGSSWSTVTSPALGKHGGALNSVSNGPDGTAWAVGVRYETRGGEFSDYGMLAEQWNGSAWVRQPVQDPGGSGDVFSLNGVSGVAADDAWAVGFAGERSGNPPESAAIRHWNGTTWATSAFSAPGQISLLEGVSASSTDDAWAVGSWYDNGRQVGLLEHWDGTTWTQFASPHISGANVSLASVVDLSPTNAWAVGTNRKHGGIILHWDGTAWTYVHQ